MTLTDTEPQRLTDRPPTAASRFYRPELDALRFFAFFSVFLFHRLDYFSLSRTAHPTWWAASMAGAFGVPIFFLLSSYLIVELLLREKRSTGRIHLPAFYTRRILRIWPLYFFAFYGLLLLGRFVPNVGPKPGAWLPFTFFFGNWFILKYGWMAGSVDPLWSISVEEQFYLCVPWIASRGGQKALFGISVAALLAAYAVIFHWAYAGIGGEVAPWCNSFFEFQFFAAGALLALALRGRTPAAPLPLRVVLAAAGAVAWYVPSRYLHVQTYYLKGEALPGVATTMLGWFLVLLGSVLFFLAILGLPARAVPRWLAYLGRISFGLYVFHSFVFFLFFEDPAGKRMTFDALHALHMPLWSMAWIGAVWVLAVTIAFATVSYYLLERPFLKLKQRFTYIPSRPE